MITICHLYRLSIILLLSLSSSITFGSAMLSNSSTRDTVPRKILPGTYLVVGVFEYEANAKRYTAHVAEQGLSAHYAFYPESGYFYVYTRSALSAEGITGAYQELRATSEFSDAWIFKAEDSDPVAAAPPNEELLSRIDTDQDTNETITPEAIPLPAEPSGPKDQRSQKMAAFEQHPTFYVKFQTTQESTEQPIAATIKVVEGARSRNIGEVSANEVLSVNKTEVLDSALQIIPYAIGYRKVQFDLPLNVTSADSVWQLTRFEEDTLVMDIPLQRLQKGDIQIMFNTYFHGNSSVMRERSRYEMNELVKMLEENLDMRIKLHGHTNGSGRGFIYTFLPEKKNFFDLIQNKEHKKRGGRLH